MKKILVYLFALFILVCSVSGCSEPEPLKTAERTELGCINLSIPVSWERTLPGPNNTIHYEFDTGYLKIQAVRNYDLDWWDTWKRHELFYTDSSGFKKEKEILIGETDAMYAERKVYNKESDTAIEKIVGFRYKSQMFIVSFLNYETSNRDINTAAFKDVMESMTLSGSYEKLTVPLFDYPVECNKFDLSSDVGMELPAGFDFIKTIEDDENNKTKYIFYYRLKSLQFEAVLYTNPEKLSSDDYDFDLVDKYTEDYISKNFRDYDRRYAKGKYGWFDAYLVSDSNGADYFLFIDCIQESGYSCCISFFGPFDNIEEAAEVFSGIRHKID